jgi:hypothetical protein
MLDFEITRAALVKRKEITRAVKATGGSSVILRES